MSQITKRFGEGGAQLTPNGTAGLPSLATTLRDIADDFTTVKTQFNALLAKLDADAGVTDVNYASLLAIPASGAGSILTIKV
jgi:hypothetical protein